jgi:hypothetical protein
MVPLKSSRLCTAKVTVNYLKHPFPRWDTANSKLRCSQIGSEALHLVLVYEGSCEFRQIPNFAFMS